MSAPAQVGTPAFRVCVLALLLVAGLAHFNAWHYFGVWHLEPLFLDSFAILSAVDCHRLGFDIYVTNPCDVLGRPLGYSRLWLALEPTGISRAENALTGYAIGALFLIVAAHAMRPVSTGQQLIALAALASPAVLLGIERANNDLLMFLLLVAAARLITVPTVGPALSWCAIALGAALKFYPVAALAAGVTQWRRPADRWVFIGVVAGLIAVAIMLIWPDNERLQHTVPSPSGRWTFGAAVIGQMVSGEATPSNMWAFGIVVTCAAIGAVISWRLPALPSLRDVDRYLFHICLATAAACYAVKVNYDYRCIFLLGTFPVLFALTNCAGLLRGVSVAAIAATLFALWAEVLQSIWVAMADPEQRAASAIHTFENASIKWAEHLVTFALMGFLAGIAFRLLRAQLSR